jgi:hypothetical protein
MKVQFKKFYSTGNNTFILRKQFHFVFGLKIIGHGNPDSNLESPCRTTDKSTTEGSRGPLPPATYTHITSTFNTHVSIRDRKSENTLYIGAPSTLKPLIYRVPQEEMSVFWEVIVSVILSKEVYMYMCPTPNGFRDRAISLYRRATRHVLTRVAKCIDVDGGIFENVLY